MFNADDIFEDQRTCKNFANIVDICQVWTSLIDVALPQHWNDSSSSGVNGCSLLHLLLMSQSELFGLDLGPGLSHDQIGQFVHPVNVSSGFFFDRRDVLGQFLEGQRVRPCFFVSLPSSGCRGSHHQSHQNDDLHHHDFDQVESGRRTSLAKGWIRIENIWVA